MIPQSSSRGQLLLSGSFSIRDKRGGEAGGAQLNHGPSRTYTSTDGRGQSRKHSIENDADWLEGLAPFWLHPRQGDDSGLGSSSVHGGDHDRGDLFCVTNSVSGATRCLS